MLKPNFFVFLALHVIAVPVGLLNAICRGTPRQGTTLALSVLVNELTDVPGNNSEMGPDEHPANTTITVSSLIRIYHTRIKET